MSVQVYDIAGSISLSKIQAVARYAGVEVQTPEFKEGSNKGKEFQEKFPLGIVPSAETTDGPLSGTNAIIRYISRTSTAFQFSGESAYFRSSLDSYLDFTINEIDLPAAAWLFPIKGYVANNPTATNKAKGDIRKVLGSLNTHLATRTFLVGERISPADISVALSLLDLYTTVLDPGFRKQFVNTNRWFLTVINQPNVAAVIGKVELCTKMAAAPNAPKKEAKKPKEQPKKQEKPKEQPKPVEEAPKKEVKKKNPLDELPASKFNLEEWKRTYSNEATRPTALAWLWENFDAEGFSFYFCHYNYPEDNSKAFMCANLVGGWMQRCDPLRKYGFGSMCIFGEDGTAPLEIKGCWIFRGQDIPAEMQETPDFESYTFAKADITDAKQKTLIEDYLAWDGNFDGLKFTGQAKIFK